MRSRVRGLVNRPANGSEFSIDARLLTIDRQFIDTFFLSKRELCFSDAARGEVDIMFVNDLEDVFQRSYLHIDSGLESFLVSKRSYLLAVGLTAVRDRQRRIVISRT
jgi:hypothetical protein